MANKKAEMSVEQIENGQIVEHVAYPYVEYEHVTMDNGMDIMSMIRDDVSTPMVTHNTTSWKVGQGDSDVSESIVDSSIASMTIKGQTYQNILPSPSLRNSMTNGKTMQKLNEGYDSVNTVDGSVKSAILKGQTLVNLAQTFGYSYSWVGSTIDENNIVTADASIGSGYRWCHNPLNIGLIKPNTQYTVIVEVFENTLDDNLEVCYSGLNGVVYGTCFNQLENIPIGFTGTYKVLATSKSNVTVNDQKLTTHIRLTNQTSGIVKYRVTILEGDYTNVDIPYFEGMQSVKMPVLTTTGKNLWNDNWSKGLTSSSGVVQTGGTYDGFRYNEDLISTKPLSTLYFKSFAPLNGMVEGARVAEFGVNKEFLKMNLGGKSFTLSENTYFIRVHFDLRYNNGVSSQAIPSDDVLTFGMVSTSPFTDYEPYKTNILTVNEEVELRGIGDVQDELDLLTGELTQRIGEVVLDGSEDWIKDSDTSNQNITISAYVLRLIDTNQINSTNIICERFQSKNINTIDEEGIYIHGSKGFRLRISIDKLSSPDINGFKTYLQSNPVTVQYLATESIKTVDLSILDQDNQPTTQLNSFANGYIQASSQGLIPSVDYEAPTSNSYHMDLMKPNTKYTIKASSASGKYTLDGTEYHLVGNGTIYTGDNSDKLLVITQGSAADLMFLEGDVKSKTIPYFKGIKSVFEDESKIEVLSTGKNIYYNNSELGNGETYRTNGAIFTKVGTNTVTITGTKTRNGNSDFRLYKAEDKYPIKKGTYTVSCQGSTNENVRVIIKPANGAYREMRLTETYTFTATNDDVFSYIIIRDSNPSGTVLNETIHLQIEECLQPTTYEPYKSNSTKIPLLSPLRSLPNGVRDEIILDRVNHKVKIIQRVGSVVLDGSFGVPSQTLGDYFISYYGVSDVKKVNGGNVYCDKFKSHGQIWAGGQEGVSTFSNSTIWLSIYSKKLEASNIDGMKKWLSQNPVTVYYELETPVITEVNLEGYPYVYKGGHIFLNTEIAPITEVTYSINQAHQIESSNEDILRHQKEINHLYQLIAQYVQVQYEAELIDIALQG